MRNYSRKDMADCYSVMVIFLGGPGTGKGTQARYLAKHDNYSIFSVGEYLRNEIKANESELGRRVGKIINSGNLIDVATVVEILHKNVHSEDVILDGMPRNVDQAEALDIFLKEKNWNKALCCIDFIVPATTIKRRLQQRMYCSACQSTFFENDRCFSCGNYLLSKREDDASTEVIDRRISYFEKEITQLKNFYEKRNQYFKVNGLNLPFEIYQKIKEIIKNFNQ